MEILGIEKVSFVDFGDKICATIFTGGCNYRCPFCHNSGIVKKEYKKYDEDEILDYLSSRKSLLDAVTISGGEPTLQPDLESFILKVKNLGYKIKLDTNGTNPTVVENLISKKLLDYVAIDIKNNFDDYKKITGVSNPLVENVKKTISILQQHKINYELRTTLVKEFHTLKNINKLAEDLCGQKILYLQKFVDSGNCIENGLTPVSKTEAIEFQNILSKTIENVMLRGY